MSFPQLSFTFPLAKLFFQTLQHHFPPRLNEFTFLFTCRSFALLHLSVSLLLLFFLLWFSPLPRLHLFRLLPVTLALFLPPNVPSCSSSLFSLSRQTDIERYWNGATRKRRHDSERKGGERKQANRCGSEEERELWLGEKWREKAKWKLRHHFASSVAPSLQELKVFCFPYRCYSNNWQFYLGATCPVDRQLAATRGTRLHTQIYTHAHTQKSDCPVDQLFKAETPWSCLHTKKLHHHLHLMHLWHSSLFLLLLLSLFFTTP